LAVLGGPHPSLCKTSLSAVFAVNTCYRNDERQLVVIGQILDMGVCEIGGYPHVIVPVTAIIDDAHTSIDGIGHLGGSGVAGSVQTSMTALEKLITGGISVALEKIVDVSDVLVIVFVVIARTLAGSDTAEDREMGCLRRILFVLDKTVHLRVDVVNGFRRYFPDDDIRIAVIAGNLTIIVVADVSVCHYGREFSTVTH